MKLGAVEDVILYICCEIMSKSVTVGVFQWYATPRSVWYVFPHLNQKQTQINMHRVDTAMAFDPFLETLTQASPPAPPGLPRSLPSSAVRPSPVGLHASAGVCQHDGPQEGQEEEAEAERCPRRGGGCRGWGISPNIINCLGIFDLTQASPPWGFSKEEHEGALGNLSHGESHDLFAKQRTSVLDFRWILPNI